MKIKLTEVPADAKLKAGDWLNVTGAEADVLTASGHKYITEADERVIKAREVAVTNAIKASKAFAPKEDTSEIKATALKLEAAEDGLGVTYIANLPAREGSELSRRITASENATTRVDMGDVGLRETVRGFLQASEQDIKLMKNGGIITATKGNEKGITEAVKAAQAKSQIAAEICRMISAGGHLPMTEDYIKATYDGTTDSALGVLNTALTLQWNLGHLENQLIMLDDVTTDLSGTPVLYNQWARSRYIKVPGVMLKTSSNSWATNASAGNDVDVMVQMANYAGCSISINNTILGSTGRQLMNEQKTPQLYGLAEYILYTVINAAINGTTRFANDGTTTSTIKAASAFVDPARGAGGFDVAGATLKTFVSDLPAAMDLSKFPGGDEAPGAADLMRYAWVHSSLYSSIAGDPAFQLNSSIQGIKQVPGENLIRTGRFNEIGNNKFRKSQLLLDNNTTSGSGADSGTNALTVVPGSYAAASTVGIAGTRSGLLFVSRVPLDYTKVLPEIPSTAAIEVVTTPKLGIPFMIVKYLDHGYEIASMRAQAMWGIGIGDERQLMLLKQQ